MRFLADQLRKLRGSKTLYQVQQETGLPRITISRYERGENIPSAANLKKLSHYYGCDYKELRILYYNDILLDEEERLIVTSWALQYLLPETNILNFYQLEFLIKNRTASFSHGLEELMLANLPSSS